MDGAADAPLVGISDAAAAEGSDETSPGAEGAGDDGAQAAKTRAAAIGPARLAHATARSMRCRVATGMRARLVGIGLGIVVAVSATACASREIGSSAQGEEERVRFVALGDSYTIGTSVGEGERWPNQLVDRVDGLELVANLGVNGYTSADLIRDELPQLDELDPGFVSVLIGVNDVVQGVPDGQYAMNVGQILDEIGARLPPEAIVCVATPDYTRTPRGGDYGDPIEQSDGIVRVNAILREACERRGIAFVPDIFEISQAVTDDGALVADDGLHPSGRQYALWVEAIEPVVRSQLDRLREPASAR